MRGLLVEDDPRGMDRARDCARALLNARALECYTRPGVEWHWAKSYEEFVQWVTSNGMPDVLAFDHDLDPSAYFLFAKHGGYAHKQIDYSEYREKTGYHCARWLVDRCLDTGEALPQEFHSHSMNPRGRDNIVSLLSRFRRFQETGQ